MLKSNTRTKYKQTFEIFKLIEENIITYLQFFALKNTKILQWKKHDQFKSRVWIFFKKKWTEKVKFHTPDIVYLNNLNLTSTENIPQIFLLQRSLIEHSQPIFYI